MQVQLHRARDSGDQNSTASLDFRLRELNTLIEINPNISKKAFEVLCQRKQTIEELPLEKLEEELHRNLDAVENMLKANKESPEEFTQWLQETIRNIEATIYYLQTTTQPTALSPLGFDL